ncbi:hypothetical protein HHK36_016253 [Tetracentron sinense]|uniref:MABP1/WDR62 second WD40 domain-containing protein n=1 Tax=Tetracentron sinense TaxID=13715 RepID=A0A834YZC5_TETSI|nr:hypothetical protein HHK36_016253 [Tetracentron sinense]
MTQKARSSDQAYRVMMLEERPHQGRTHDIDYIFCPIPKRLGAWQTFPPVHSNPFRSKLSEAGTTLDLEEIVGLTTKNANGLASNISNGDCVYLAGCVVVIYNVESGTQSHLMVPHRMPKPLSCVAVSQDGRCVAAGESGHQPAVLVWDHASQDFISELKGHQYGVASIAFSPDGKHMVSVGFPHDGYLCLWEWRSGRLVTKLKASTSCSAISSVSFSSDANFFVTAGKKHLKFWTVGSSTRPRSNIGAGSLAIYGKSANLGVQKGSSFISVTSPIWTANNLVGADQAVEGYPIYALTDAGFLCLLHSGFSVRKWVDLKVEKGFALSVSNKLIACACSNGIIQLFAIGNLKYAGSLQYSEAKESHQATDIGCHAKSVEKGFESASTLPDAIACRFSTSEKLAVIYGDHSLYIWDINDVHNVTRCCVLVSHSACIWDVKNLSCENMHDPALACVARGCPGGVSFATCATDGTVRLWNLDLQPDSLKKIEKLEVDADQHSLISEQVNTIHLVSAGILERDIVESGVGNQGFRSMAVSSDGKYLAAGDCQGNLHIYNLHTFDYTCFQDAHDAEILSLSFSLPSKKNVISGQVAENHYFLASGGRDRIIHLYDVKRGFSLIESVDDHSAAVTSVKFCNGFKILSCSADRSLVFRDVAVTDSGCKILCCHHQMASNGTVYDLAVDTASEVAVTVGQDKKINTFNITTRKLIKTFKQDGDFGEPIKVNMDPSSSYLVCSYSNKSICIYDLMSGELVAQAAGHSEIITGVIFLTDCKHIISVGGDGCIFIWKVPFLLSSRMLQRMKKNDGPLSPTSIGQPIDSSESILHEEVGHEFKIDPKYIPVLENSNQDGQRVFFQEGGSQEISAFKFSISRLPKWAQAKVTNKGIVTEGPEFTSSQLVALDFLLPSVDDGGSSVDDGGTYAPMCPEVHTPCKYNLEDSEPCLANMSRSSFNTDNSKSSPVPQEMPSSFVMDKRWLTIHTVCLDLLDSPEMRDIKEVPNLSLQNPAMERPSGEGIDITLGHPIVANHLSVEPSCGTGNQIVDDGWAPPLSEDARLNTSVYICENEDQPGVHSANKCHEAVLGEVSAEQLLTDTVESLVQTTMDNENCHMKHQDDLFSQHFSNLSSILKMEGRKSSARRSYSAHFVVRQDHLTGCKRLFDSPNRNLGGEALNKGEESVPHSSLSDPSIQVLKELQMSNACNEDVKNSTRSLLSRTCTLRHIDSTKCCIVDNLMNMEGIKEEHQRVGIPEETEIEERISDCKEALLSLDAAAKSALQLFSKLEVLVSKEDASGGFGAELYDQAAELLPSITEKVHAIAESVQSSKKGSCRVEVCSFEPLLGRFAESLSHRVLEIVKKNL